MGYGLSAEAFGYDEVGCRRVAIPLSTIRWENDIDMGSLVSSAARDKSKPSVLFGGRKGLTSSVGPVKEHKPLTDQQAILRQTAINVVVGLMESLEPVLMKESGKKQDEWDRWWAALMADLLENEGTLNGESLEIGVWWARKASIQEA